MQISANKYTIQIPSSSKASTVLSDVGLMQDDKMQASGSAKSVAGSNGSSFDTSASALQASLSASALDKASTGTQFDYSGPNYDAVKATNDRAIASGLSGGYDGDEILTDNDKAIIGYDPNDPASVNAANAIAGSRYNGSLTGDITSDFLSNLQDYYDLSDATIQGMQYRLSQLTDSGS